jgi:hypothetical protein
MSAIDDGIKHVRTTASGVRKRLLYTTRGLASLDFHGSVQG